ncbi:Vacuolar protein sorting-associated protein 27 [Bienertia sinuspersici]
MVEVNLLLTPEQGQFRVLIFQIALPGNALKLPHPLLAPIKTISRILGLVFLSGFMPMATARFGNITMSAGFGGILPWSMMSAQFNGFPHNPMYGAAHGFPYGYQQTVHGNRMHHGHGYGHSPDFPHHHGVATQGQDSLVKLLFIIGFLVLAALMLCDFSW